MDKRLSPITISPRMKPRTLAFLCAWFLALIASAPHLFAGQPLSANAPYWPQTTRESRPWAYWWWMGSAVDKTNLTRELQRYSEAGLGGVHIIPIYGAKGFETNFIKYLTPRWLEMLDYTVRQANRLDMGVDMTTGTGWCFGGPHVTDQEANASVVEKVFQVKPGHSLDEKFPPKSIQTLMAFSSQGQRLDLTRLLNASGAVHWTAPAGNWQVYAISQRPSGQKVKRAAPGGEGHMLNLFYPQAMRHYLGWFDSAFAHYNGLKPRAMYQDSYEYRSDWAPDLFASFEKRRGYRLQNELPALFAQDDSIAPDQVARVKCDYRETLSDIMAEDTLPMWVQWSHRHGFITRNEAHGSPGNLLDLYALADIPETEMFYQDRNKLVSKFASSAANVAGRRFASSETGTWLKEHFTETLADVKYLFDDMFLSGINHMFYHGTCYSPDEAGWPGWHFYASLEMNPRNSIWHDVPVLNAYATRCQSILQSGHPDNDILLYWPIYDFWQNPEGRIQQMTVHARAWLEAQPLGEAADTLWKRGYSFDYISDRWLASAKTSSHDIEVPGGLYRVLVVPSSRLMPDTTLRKLIALAESGATIIFQDRLPSDVPGWGQLEKRRAQFKRSLEQLTSQLTTSGKLKTATLKRGLVLIGPLEAALQKAAVTRETLFDETGLMCIRRGFPGGRYYFIANRSESHSVDGWVPLAKPAQSVTIMDPMSGKTGLAALRTQFPDRFSVRLQLAPGESVVLCCLDASTPGLADWNYWKPEGPAVQLDGNWSVAFLQGGPELPRPFETAHLASWTQLNDTNAQRFAGSALYTTHFDAPSTGQFDGYPGGWQLDLGSVCQSARVWLNGVALGTLVTPPFRIAPVRLKPTDNVLEVEVTNVSANRIRDLDRRGVRWKNFYDINIVSLDYRPFNAADWPLRDSGLLGPVALTPITQTMAEK